MIDLPTTRRNLRQQLAVYRTDSSMPVPTVLLTMLLDALDAREAQVQRVRELHSVELHSVLSCGGTWCEHYPCRACGEGWPCTTIRSLDEEPDDYPEPACLIHDITGEDVPGWEMAECTCPSRALGGEMR